MNTAIWLLIVASLCHSAAIIGLVVLIRKVREEASGRRVGAR